ncbi:hypothetical protein J4573_49195 [Actinomadura barringtoniae]|uniref:Uncharacterized protein n=1 Tax=Actinomadura barringtoniae TaxID=1427535 RepID=A0A939TA88_9ACTN|nr:hypothetical protein [Actinomadura barringtoniae]MBO2455139.1 hypothetical protein [Actinomadura barringtoniae]
MRRPRRLLAAALAALGLASIIGGGTAIAADITRKPTAKERDKAGEKEIATRWRRLNAAEIFPTSFEPGLATQYAAVNGNEKDPLLRSQRAGIAAPAPCAEALDPKLAAVALKHGCSQVLRATYVDSSGTMATTLGIAVMPDSRAVDRAEGAFDSALGTNAAKERFGVRVVAFPGTPARNFADANRQDFFEGSNGTPYLFFRSSGWLVARGHVDRDRVTETFGFADTALGKVIHTFSLIEAPCKRKDVRC